MSRRAWLLPVALVALACSGDPPSDADGGADAGDGQAPDSGMDPGGSVIEPRCSEDGWCWSNPLPHGDRLTAVWGMRPSDVWAVGRRFHHWDGEGWTRFESPRMSQNPFDDLWGSGEDDIYASSLVSVHWDGNEWTRVLLEDNNPVSGRAVWGTGPDEVWIGAVGGTSMDRWDGSAWTTHDLPEWSVITGIWGAGSDEVWAVGYDQQSDGVVFSWDGAAWTRDTSSQQELEAVWGAGPGDVWAVGHSGLVLHWNGAEWSSEEVGSYNLYGVWGSGPADVWAVGAGGFVHHYDGSEWSLATHEETDFLFGVWAAGPDHAVAVGSQGRVLRYDGEAWRAEGDGLYGLGRVHDLWGAHAESVWVATNNGLAHFDGERWTHVEEVIQSYRGLWGFAEDDVWVVGEEGIARHWDGEAWSDVSTGVDREVHLRDVWGASPQDVWVAAGVEGLLHWDGERFSNEAGVDGIIRTVHGCASDPDGNVWAASESDVIYRWTGTAWSETSPPDEADGVEDVVCAGPDDAWAIAGGEVLRWEGSEWTLVHSVSPGSLEAIATDGDGTVWVAGSTGHIERWDGETWTRPSSDTFADLRALWADERAVFAAGGSGLILRRDRAE